MAKEKIILFVFLCLLLLGILFFASGCTVGNAICGTHTETSTSAVKGCDNMNNCRCLHYNFWGTCDSCECWKEVSNC